MKSWIKIGVGSLCLYLTFLIATIPASFVIDKVKLPKMVKLGVVSGTIWQGNFDSISIDGVVLKNVSWSIVIPKLLTAELGVDFKLGSQRKILEPYGKGYAFVSMNSMGVLDTKLSLPANIAAPKLKRYMVESLEGMIKLDVASASLGTPYCGDLTGQVNWQQSALGVMGSQFALGDLNVQLGCRDGNLTAAVKGDDKVLVLDGKAELKAKNQAKVDGFVKAGPSADKSLIAAMSFMGKADQQGRYKISYGR